jgi:hypothetical protein
MNFQHLDRLHRPRTTCSVRLSLMNIGSLAAAQIGGYLGSGYGLGPITQSDLVCWPVRRPIDGRAPAILLVPAGDQVAVPAWRHCRV